MIPPKWSETDIMYVYLGMLHFYVSFNTFDNEPHPTQKVSKYSSRLPYQSIQMAHPNQLTIYLHRIIAFDVCIELSAVRQQRVELRQDYGRQDLSWDMKIR